LKKGADPSSVQIFMEDCASITGIAIAAICLSLSHYLAMPIFDHIGSIAIGCLLSFVASFLIKRNISGLVETSISPERQNEIVMILQKDPIVMSVHDVKCTSMGSFVRFKAEILLDGEEVARRYMSKEPNLMNAIKDEAWFLRHSTKLIACVGAEIDRLERKVTDRRPEVKHIDLEIL
jgi:zinc transporter 9